jgi:hypothetical protein
LSLREYQLSQSATSQIPKIDKNNIINHTDASIKRFDVNMTAAESEPGYSYGYGEQLMTK